MSNTYDTGDLWRFFPTVFVEHPQGLGMLEGRPALREPIEPGRHVHLRGPLQGVQAARTKRQAGGLRTTPAFETAGGIEKIEEAAPQDAHDVRGPGS
ncbi:MAG: hypothetical protein ABEK84_02090 [Salinibacter sp.]